MLTGADAPCCHALLNSYNCIWPDLLQYHSVTEACFMEHRWLLGNSSAGYDLIAMAAADEVEAVQQACPHCLLVYNHGLDHVAGRYAALTRLVQTAEWQNSVADKYEFMYFPEEEIVQTVDSINRYAPCSSNGEASWCLQLK